MTDGADQHSRLKASELIQIVQSSRAQVYMIGDFSAGEHEVYRARDDTITLVSGRQIDNPVLVFEHLSSESGAECYFPVSPGTLRRAIKDVASELQTQYTLGYYPASSDNSYRQIQVKVRPYGLKVFTRHGFSTEDPGVYFSVDACAISPQQHPYPYESKLTREDGRLVYHEDFADPQSGWPLNSSSWYGSSDYHILRKGRVEVLGEGTVCAYGPWWNDLRVSVSVKLSPAPNNAGWITSPGAGVVFRLNDRGYYALLIGSAPGLHAKLIAKSFNVPQAMDLMPWTRIEDERPLGTRDWNRLRVDCHGDLISLYVNDHKIGAVQNASFPDGYVGVTLFGPGHAVFRDLIAEDSK